MANIPRKEFNRVKKVLLRIKRDEGYNTANYANIITEVVQSTMPWWSTGKQNLSNILYGVSKTCITSTHQALLVYIKHMEKLGLYKP